MLSGYHYAITIIHIITHIGLLEHPSIAHNEKNIKRNICQVYIRYEIPYTIFCIDRD